MFDYENDWIEDEFEYFVRTENPQKIEESTIPTSELEQEAAEEQDGMWEILTDLNKLRKYWAEIFGCLLLIFAIWIWGIPLVEHYLLLGKRFLYLLSFAIPLMAVWGFGKVNKQRIASKYYQNKFGSGVGSVSSVGSVGGDIGGDIGGDTSRAVSLGVVSRNVSNYMKKFVAANQQWHCALCGTLLDASYEIDHILPLYRGGTNTIENLQALCRNCHGRKTIRDSLIS